MARAGVTVTGGKLLKKFLRDAKRSERRNEALAVDIGWIDTNEAVTAWRNEFGEGVGKQSRPRPALRNTQDRAGEIVRPILRTLPDDREIGRVRAEAMGEAVKAELRQQVTRLGVVDTGTMRRQIAARVTLTGLHGPGD